MTLSATPSESTVRWRLLAAGYLPKEIPPPFTSRSLADAEPALSVSTTETEPVGHHLAQVGHKRRVLAIPNPLAQVGLCRALASNWTEVMKAARVSPISASRPEFHSTGPRAILPEGSFTSMPQLRAEARASARFVLKTDVAQFFPSIYTHAVPWALHTKAVAKANRNDKSLLGNVLDDALRRGQHGETQGIPIGPDTSMIISELVLAPVDARVFDGDRGFRWVDDYEISGSTYAECEKILGRLEAALHEFRLHINVPKSRIVELPEPVEDLWVPRLRNFVIRAGKKQRHDLTQFFSMAFELGRAAEFKPVLRYALRMLHSAALEESTWPHVQNLLTQAAMHEPEVLPHVLGVINKYEMDGLPVAKGPLQRTLDSIAERYAARQLGSEVAWAVWGSIQFSIPLSEKAWSYACEVRDAVVLTLLLDAHSKGLCQGRDPRPLANGFVSATAFREDSWLVVYEGLRHGWLDPSTPAAKAFQSSLEVAQLMKAGVGFYDAGMPANASARHTYGTPSWLWYPA